MNKILICFFAATMLFISCEKKTKLDYDFLIYVDSIQLSDNISANIPFDIFFMELLAQMVALNSLILQQRNQIMKF